MSVERRRAGQSDVDRATAERAPAERASAERARSGSVIQLAPLEL